MDDTHDATTPTYEPPRLRALGSVHELTQGGLGSKSDGLLFQGDVTGIVNGS